MRYEIRQLGVGGVLDQAINLTKNHFGLFFKIALVLLICSAVIGLLSVWATPNPAAMQGPDAADFLTKNPSTMLALMGLGLLALFVTIIVQPLTNAAVIYAVASCYLDMAIGVGVAFRRAWRIFMPMFGTALLAGLFVVLGGLCLVIPGIILFFRYLLVTHVVVIEGTTGTAALKRSRDLMKGNAWTAFVLIVLVAVVTWGVAFMQAMLPQREIGVIIASVLHSALFIFTTASWVVFYFSCRCKLDNFDLVMLADAVGTEEPPSEIQPAPGR